MAKVISKEKAKEITGTYIASKSDIEKYGDNYIESEFYSIESIKELINGVAVRSIKGVKIRFGKIIRDGKESLTTVLELVTKDTTIQARIMAEPDSTCPDDCR